ncbi:Sodium/hydrogen exchanger 8 [Nymphon striatum]|nr:Sodium/hydrogen exchanger 8 [Nymphon striatum]
MHFLVLFVILILSCSEIANEVPPSSAKPLPNSTVVPLNISNNGNGTNVIPPTNTSAATDPTIPEVTDHDPNLPGKGSAEEEHHSSMAIFFILIVAAVCILVIHFLIQSKFNQLPESIAIIFIGALIGLIMKLILTTNVGDWQKEEALNPTTFFLVILPPIIFESGYNLHKGNFFQNIGSILVFAILGTAISAFVVGGGVYLLGLADVAYKLSFTESFAFGSLISAVDPVATLAIFAAMDVDPVLYMLVFGESILNDAVSIVLLTTVLKSATPEMANVSSSYAFAHGVGTFCLMFFASAAIGVIFALTSALISFYIDLRKHPSLELGFLLIFCYAPYGLAEGIHLSGIMAILFCAIVMSHYTHFNLSPVTQITMQQTLRMLSFLAETLVFAYLGMAIFSFKHVFKPSLVIWSIILILVGRALNIFPLAYLMNYFREHKITKRMMFIMWFSGLRGAIAYALSLHLEFEEEKRHVLGTTTLIIVLFTVLILGGFTMPVMKYINPREKKKRTRKKKKVVSMSKTKGMGQAIDAEHLSELTEEEYETNYVKEDLKGFVKYDAKYFIPFFTRRFTQEVSSNLSYLPLPDCFLLILSKKGLYTLYSCYNF